METYPKSPLCKQNESISILNHIVKPHFHPMVEINFIPDAQDIIRIAKRKQLRPLRLLYLFFILLFLIFSVPEIIKGERSILEAIVLEIPVLTIIVIIIEYLWPLLIKRNLQKLTSWGYPVKFIFEEDQIQQRSLYTESTLQWQSFSRAEMIDNQLLLYLGPKNTYIQIPDRAFADAGQKEKLKDLLQKKLLLK